MAGTKVPLLSLMYFILYRCWSSGASGFSTTPVLTGTSGCFSQLMVTFCKSTYMPRDHFGK